jgi:hypothetical protein
LPCDGDAAAILTCVRAREDAIHSLRARFRAVTRGAGANHTTHGVLLVDKPQRFRLRLMLPLGLTVFDYTKDGDRQSVSLPLRGSGAGPADPFPFSEIDLAEVFLRGEKAFPGSCIPDGGGRGEVRVRCSDGAGRWRREIQLDASRGVISSETSFSGESPRLTVTYDDYRTTAGTVLPYRISVMYPGRGIGLEIEIDRYDVNPHLSPALFVPDGKE